jgi:hypothetical protein
VPRAPAAAAGSWLQLSVCVHLQGNLPRTQMEGKMFKLTYTFISHAERLVLSAAFHKPTPSLDKTLIAHVSHANMQVLLLDCSLMLRL